MSARRPRTRAELLARFRALAAAEQAARDAPARTLDAALDAICELQVMWALDSTAFEPRDAVVAEWVRETLGVQLTPGQPVPREIASAFRRAQAALWDGQPVDPLRLVDDSADPPPPAPNGAVLDGLEPARQAT